MVLVSTPKSTSEREVSALAVVEILVATAITLAIAVSRGSTWHIGIASILAVTLMVRTPESIETGARWFEALVERCHRLSTELESEYEHRSAFHWRSVLYLGALMLMLLCLVLGPLLVRFTATVYCVVKHPIAAVRGVPSNWYQSSCCTDLVSPVELVPRADLQKYTGDTSARVTVRWSDRLLSIDPRTSGAEIFSVGGITALVGGLVCLFASVLFVALISPALLSLPGPGDDGLSFAFFALGVVAIATVVAIAGETSSSGESSMVWVWIVIVFFGLAAYANPSILWSGPWLAGVVVVSVGFSLVLLLLVTGAVVALAASPARFVLTLPAYAYRLSVKSVAFLAAPIAFAARRAYSEQDLRLALEDRTSTNLARFLAKLAWLSIGLVIVKTVVMIVWIKIQHQWEAWSHPIFDLFVVPHTIPMWQVASFVNATITLFWFYQGELWLRRLATVDAATTTRIHTAIKVTMFVQTVLSLYAYTCNTFLAFGFAGQLEMVALGEWWPW